jgi:RNA polymerase sigma-70 factor (ECF subfamily)
MAIDPRTVEAARRGDEAALSALIGDVWPLAYRTAFAIVHEPEAAKDAAQDACALMCVELKALRDPAAFGAWFARIVTTTALRAMHRHARFTGLSADLTDRTNVCDAVTERIALDGAIDALPRSLRVPLLLHYVHGLRGEEIARALGIAHGTVRYRLSVARRRVFERLHPEAAAMRERVPVVPVLRSRKEML